MLAAWLKALHIVTLAIWAGGLLALPGLTAREFQTAGAERRDPEDHFWTHRMSRFVYDVIVSPAALIAIGSGVALIFVTRPLDGWLFLKLGAVSGLVFAHMAVGRLVDQSESPHFHPTRPVRITLFLATILFISLILGLVLYKPAVPHTLLPGWLIERPKSAPLPLFQDGSSGAVRLMPT